MRANHFDSNFFGRRFPRSPRYLAERLPALETLQLSFCNCHVSPDGASSLAARPNAPSACGWRKTCGRRGCASCFEIVGNPWSVVMTFQEYACYVSCLFLWRMQVCCQRCYAYFSSCKAPTNPDRVEPQLLPWRNWGCLSDSHLFGPKRRCFQRFQHAWAAASGWSSVNLQATAVVALQAVFELEGLGRQWAVDRGWWSCVFLCSDFKKMKN